MKKYIYLFCPSQAKSKHIFELFISGVPWTATVYLRETYTIFCFKAT